MKTTTIRTIQINFHLNYASATMFVHYDQKKVQYRRVKGAKLKRIMNALLRQVEEDNATQYTRMYDTDTDAVVVSLTYRRIKNV